MFVILWIAACCLMTAAFFQGKFGERNASGISSLILMYVFLTAGFLIPAVSIAQGKQAEDRKKVRQFRRGRYLPGFQKNTYPLNNQFEPLSELLEEQDIPVWPWHGDISQSVQAAPGR